MIVTKFTNKLADPETQKFFGQDAQQHMSYPPRCVLISSASRFLCKKPAVGVAGRKCCCTIPAALAHTHTHTHTHTHSVTHTSDFPAGIRSTCVPHKNTPLLESGSRPFSGRSMALQYTDWVTQDSNISAFIRMEVSEHNRR
jgi:hypothetical protein